MLKAGSRAVVPGPEIHELPIDQDRTDRERYGAGIAHLPGNAPHEAPTVQREDDLRAVGRGLGLERRNSGAVVSVHVGGDDLDGRIADPRALRQALDRVAGIPAHGAAVGECRPVEDQKLNAVGIAVLCDGAAVERPQ